jgi:hypothetical protein
MDELQEYVYLWDGTEPGWSLLKLKPGPAGTPRYGILNVVTQSTVIIEDDEVSQAAKAEMLARGCLVLSKIPWSVPSPVSTEDVPSPGSTDESEPNEGD